MAKTRKKNAVVMVDGPRAGRVFGLGPDYPAMLCFQECVDGRWVRYDYLRERTEDGTAFYRFRPFSA